MKKVYFVCVNYNNSNFTIDYIKSVISLNNFECVVKVIVVDNNSKAEDLEVLNDFVNKYEFVILKRNRENLGYFKGLNEGIKLIRDDFHYIIVGNNDLTFKNDFLTRLFALEVLKDNDLVIAPNIISLEGFAQNPVSIQRISWLRRLFLRIYFFNYYIGMPLYYFITNYRRLTNKASRNFSNTRNRIHHAYGACYILTRNFFNYYQLLDDSIFLYGEEALLAQQVKRANGFILYEPSLIVNHYEHATVEKLESLKHYKIRQSAYKKYRKFL